MSDVQPEWQRRAKATWHARYHDQYAQRDQQILADRRAPALLTLSQIAAKYGISRARAGQICRKAARLRRLMARDNV